MALINSVLGPLNTADLGFTLSHEHVVTASAGIQYTYPEFINRSQVLEDGVTQLKAAYEEGIRTIVDVTTMDLGRDIRLLEEVSRRSGVNIIPATGVWLDIPQVFRVATPDMIAPLFIREIDVGIEGTGIKAGIIKVATAQGTVTPDEEIILRAAARAERVTGAPISTHTSAPERGGEDQVRILEEEGTDLSRVYIGHSNDTADMDYLLGLLQKGVWLGLDRFQGSYVNPGTPSSEERIEVVKNLIDAGFGHKIMLSHDWSVRLLIRPLERRTYRAGLNPDGYLFISRTVVPRLKELGATDRDIENIFVNNPRRFFEGSQ